MRQENLHRIGEVTAWETMTRLTRFADGAGLVRERKKDAAQSCTGTGPERRRAPLHQRRFNLPVYIESRADS